MKICGSPIKMSETPGEVYAPAPMLGEHTEEVLRGVLGYSPERIARLKAEGAVKAAA
jgi:crotonobetainyl-CoA:carnitine CoA-transferase CaiB-like acyl-CoA transferase